MATKTAPRKAYVATPEAAAYLGYEEKTLRNWRSLGEGPPYHKVGYTVRYAIADLDAWMKTKTP